MDITKNIFNLFNKYFYKLFFNLIKMLSLF